MAMMHRKEARPLFQKFLDEGKHWLITLHTPQGMKLLEQIGSKHFCFDPDSLPVFPVVKEDTKHVVMFAFIEKERVDATDMAKYINELNGFDPDSVDGGKTTAMELIESNGIVITSGHQRDLKREKGRVGLIEWVQAVIGEKYF